jgi:hypothetical protein
MDKTNQKGKKMKAFLVTLGFYIGFILFFIPVCLIEGIYEAILVIWRDN